MNEETPIRSIMLPITLTNGNEGRTKHYWQAAKFRKEVESLLIAMDHIYTPFPTPVWLRITRLMGPRMRQWDMDSWQRGNLKELIDSLVACGWFHDDSPKWITEVRFRQEKSVESVVLIEVFTS